MLRSTSVAIIGVGSVGGRIALHLARAGVGGLVLVDPKRYKPASVATHEIERSEVGEFKALSLARRCRDISPSSRVVAFPVGIETLDTAALVGLDLVAMAPDLLRVEAVVAQRCLWSGTPLVQASIHGPTMTAQTRFVRNADGSGPCPLCSYGRAELDLLNRHARFSCEESGQTPSPGNAPSTNSFSALCAMAADMAAMRIVLFLLKAGKPGADAMLEFCGFTGRTVTSALLRSARCPLDHTRFKQLQVDVPITTLSPGRLAELAMDGPPAPTTQFQVADADWVEFCACNCSQPTPLRRFTPRSGMKPRKCPRCSSPLLPLSFYTYPTVTASRLGLALDRQLNRLGVKHAGSVLVRSGDCGVLIRRRPDPRIL